MAAETPVPDEFTKNRRDIFDRQFDIFYREQVPFLGLRVPDSFRSVVKESVLEALMIKSSELRKKAWEIDSLVNENPFIKDEINNKGYIAINMARFKEKLKEPSEDGNILSADEIERIANRSMRAEIAQRLTRKILAERFLYKQGSWKELNGVLFFSKASRLAYMAIDLDFFKE